jgi:hypothetical protein
MVRIAALQQSAPEGVPMTGRLHLHLVKDLMGDPVDRAAVASIRALPATGAGQPDIKIQQEVVIPSGSSPPIGVELDPGRYLVEATLPSGDLVSDEVEVVNNQDATLELRPDESPHEWLSWQQLMGNIEPRPQYRQDLVPFAPSEPNVGWVADPVPPLRGDAPPADDAWTLLAELTGNPGDAATRLSTGPASRFAPFASDPQTQLYQVTANGPWNDWRLPSAPPIYRAPPTPRRYFIVESQRATHLVCLPVPWTSLSADSPDTELPAQIVVRKRAAEGDLGITVTIRDPQIGSALGYMTLGALPTAERLFDQATHMVQRKQTNPLGAAGAGYVLLGTERGSEPKDWHDWINNLLNWFQWLPDGAIQHGWLKLRHRRSSADVNEARDALFTAYKRGLPFYSAGLQWLMDGLTLFTPHDSEAAEMLHNVRRVAWQTNFQEPFTIIRLPLS